MSVKSKKRALLVVCSLFLVTFLAGMVLAQTVQDEKKALGQTSTQSQFSYQKMVQSEECTQQMAQNQYTYEKKVQNKTANSKMTQNINGSNSGTQGQQGDQEDQGSQGQQEDQGQQGNQGTQDSRNSNGGGKN